MPFTIDLADEGKVENGTWFESEGQAFLIARADNVRFSQRVEALKRPHKRRLEKGDDQLATEIYRKAISEALLLDWKGVTDPDGNEIPYTPEQGYRLLQQSIEFQRFILQCSQDEEAFYKEKQGKSQKRSSGN